MKNIFKKAKSKVNELAMRTACTIENKRAEMYVDKGIGIIIAVVVGALLLGGIYALFDTTIIPRMTEEISEMFNYAG